MGAQSFRALSGAQIDECAALLKMSMPKEGWRITFTPWRDRRSLSQNAFQHAIYKDISDYLISRGRRDCTPEWIKDMLKNKFLGWVQVEFVDVETGEKRIREVLRSSAALDKGESHHYTEKIIEWSESIGCHIKIPARCEYREMMERQCA